MIIKTIMQVVMAFFATLSFSIIFNVPKKEVVFCGLTGCIGWFFYQFVIVTGGNNYVTLSSFIATLFIAAISRFLSYRRKTPVTVYLISGIIPLVPGAGIYYTMYGIINNDNFTALATGIDTLKIAGVICVGMLIILSLPREIFDF